MSQITKYGCFEVPLLVIQGDCNDQAASTVVLNRLPGISLKVAASVTKEEWVSGVAMLRELERAAIDQVQHDLNVAVADRGYLFKSLLSSQRLGSRTDTYTPVTGEVGVEFVRSRLRGNYLTIQVPHIEISVDQDITVDLKINVDGVETTRNCPLYKDRVNAIDLNLEGTKLVRITWDPAGAGVGGYAIGSSSGCCAEFCCNSCLVSRAVELSGGNYINSGKPNGITTRVSCRISECEIYGQFQQEIAHAVALQTGILTMQHLIASTRSNPVVANSKVQAKDLLIDWEGGNDRETGFEKPGRYPKRIEQIAKVISLFIKDNCVAGYETTGTHVVESIP